MALGTALAASLVSSDMCAAVSTPRLHDIPVSWPIMTASVMPLKPPVLENSVHTWLCEAFGALTQMGTNQMK